MSWELRLCDSCKKSKNPNWYQGNYLVWQYPQEEIPWEALNLWGRANKLSEKMHTGHNAGRSKYLWWELMEGRTILWLEANSAGIWSSSVWGYCLERLGQKCSKFTQRACGKRCKVAKASGDGCIHYKARHERLSHAFVLRSRLQMKHKSWFYYNSRTKTSLHCNKIWNKACFWFNKKIIIS